MTLDRIDRLLLSALEKDARQSVVALARVAGLSRSATQARLKALERSGVIEQYTIRAREPIVTPSLSAYFALTLEANAKHARILETIANRPEVRKTSCVAGGIDIIVEAEAPDVAELDRLRAALASTAGVAFVQTYTVLRTHARAR